MKLSPINGYIEVVEVVEEATTGAELMMAWAKKPGELVVVRILSGERTGAFAVVITSTIQKFDFKDKQFSTIPASGIIGYLEEI